MNILQHLYFYAQNQGHQLAIRSGDSCLTYGELDSYSSRLANFIQQSCGDNRAPVIVYGHKQVEMILCFLASVKSGRPYCPLDVSMPDARVNDIIDAVRPSMIFDLEQERDGAVCRQQLEDIIENAKEPVNPRYQVKGDDVFYIIFTSGSTGSPKGVQITADNLNCYLKWSVDLGSSRDSKQGKVFLNQAPFSFDLSVMDLYTCLACGGTLYLLDKATQMDFKKLIPALEASHAAVWVSTPSFANMCMADKKFRASLMPNLETFLFCGETLTNDTAQKLMERFPEAAVINTYGPTESTVAVTETLVTEELASQKQPLPVGKAKPGTFLEIHREDGSLARIGESGEIIIIGDTVSAGYFGRPDLTRKAFFTSMKRGRSYRAYRTGDKGYLDGEGFLYYEGRMDLQVKLNGYRIEIEDIEKNLVRLEEIAHAVVVPNMKDGKVKSLTAFVTGSSQPGNGSKFSKAIKDRLKTLLPAYMIPKKIIRMESLPMNHNGKVDRKKLGGMAR